MEDKMVQKLLALIAKLRRREDAVLENRMSTLAGARAAARSRGPVSPFRYVAPRAV